MKKLLLLFALTGFLAACSSSDDDDKNDPVTSDIDTSGLTMTPNALGEFNGSNYGYYKGIVTGNSGVVELNLNNDGTVWAKMTIDGQTYNFTTDETVTLNENVSGLTFTSGNNSFDFNVSATGANPTITNLSLENHPFAFIEIIKEFSTDLVRAYSGTFSGDDSGTFNLLRIGNMIYGLSQSAGDEDSFWIEGTIDTDLKIDGVIEGGTFEGYVNGATLYGTWDAGADDGSWTSARSL